ncbi:hypothetical protein C6503_12500, partial [Candidatus Poribacteria bacterium]
MKRLFENKRYSVSIFLAVLMVFGTHVSSYANNAPVFTDGSSTIRTIAENTASGTNIGTAFAATDADSGDTLTYTVGGADAAAFSIVSTSGQLQTKAELDYETKSSYSVRVSVSDNNGGSASIDVAIRVTDVTENRAPVFSDGASTTRTIAENTAPGTNIGTPVAATDADPGDTLTYTLGGTDATSFSINGTTGQLQTRTALDYETKRSYSVTVTASDSSLTDNITVTITVTNVNEAPVFPDDISTTRTIAENIFIGTNIGTPIAATDVDNDTLTYVLSSSDPVVFSTFSLDSTSGQLQTTNPLDYETKNSYSVTVSVSDGKGGSDSITVTITVTDVNEGLPSFTEGSSTRRTIAENTASGTNIGTPIAATDADSGDTLTYTLSGTDAAAFSIVSTSGQLQTLVALDYETKWSYSVTVSVSDGKGGSDSITVTITVTDVNENVVENNAPVFSDGASTTRTVGDYAAFGENIGRAVAATDADSGDTLTYTLSGTDASAFSIVSTSGQLQTRVALDYEMKHSYSVTVSVSDGKGGSDSITVTINVTDASEFTPVNRRTQQVQNAIVAAVRGVNHANDVTAAHLAVINQLNLNNTAITSLKSGDFSGLTALTTLRLRNNFISDISALEDLTLLTSLRALYLSNNSISDISALEDLTSLTSLDLNNNAISDISALEDLTSLTSLDLNNNAISDISALEDLTSLTSLDLNNNAISDISALEDLTSLRTLYLAGNPISDYGPVRRLKAAVEAAGNS